MYFAWRAAGDPQYASYAAANMTGANRLLVGIGWPLVVVLAVLTARRLVPAKPSDAAEARAALPVALPPDARLDNAVLLSATPYSFKIPINVSCSLIDLVVLDSIVCF